MTPEQTKKFKYWQTRTIIVSMIGYALYYFVRKNFNTAMPSIEATFGITKTQLGIFLTLNGVIYGVSRFINGFIADRVSAPILFGTLTVDDDQVFNSALVWRAGVGVVEQYDKRYPVPFAEYLPDRAAWSSLLPFVPSLIPVDMTPGTTAATVQVNGVPIGLALCFDIVSDQLVPIHRLHGRPGTVPRTAVKRRHKVRRVSQVFRPNQGLRVSA